jgi:hypothetical protein
VVPENASGAERVASVGSDTVIQRQEWPDDAVGVARSA